MYLHCLMIQETSENKVKNVKEFIKMNSVISCIFAILELLNFRQSEN